MEKKLNIPREKAAGERLKNKVCVVSGGSKGMGRAFCQALAAEGAKVAVLARQSNELETIVQEIGSNAKSVACDVSNPESIDTAFTTILETFGRIDSVISNAAITSLLKIETASISEVQQDIAVNFLGPVFLTRAAIPHLRAAGTGAGAGLRPPRRQRGSRARRSCSATATSRSSSAPAG